MGKAERASTTEWCRRVNNLNQRIAEQDERIAELEKVAEAMVEWITPIKSSIQYGTALFDVTESLHEAGYLGEGE